METFSNFSGTRPFLIISLCVFILQCQPFERNTKDLLKQSIDKISVINTHEHQRSPHEPGEHQYSFYHLLNSSYLNADIQSAGSPWISLDILDSLSNEELWNRYGAGLDYTRNTSYYSHFVNGFQKLYDFNDLFFTKENLKILNGQIENNYKDYQSWFDTAFKLAGYELMFNDQYWDPFNTNIDENYFALVFHINPLVTNASNKPEPGTEKSNIYKLAENDGYEINNLDEYLRYCDFLFKKNISQKAVCVKNSLAYSRSLDFEDIPFEEADDLFNQASSSLTKEERKKIQDFVFHWIIAKSIEYDLPIQIHTGYLAGNGNVLDNGQPIKLNNLFLKYREAKFVLFHGGFPWTGEYAALGKMFPNVYLDMVWLPQISREEAISAFDVMLDCVPYNKFFWGGDCALIEESVGSLEFGKDVVAEVLSKRIERGLLTIEVAEDIAKHMFRENAIEVFQLNKRLGKDFD